MRFILPFALNLLFLLTTLTFLARPPDVTISAQPYPFPDTHLQSSLVLTFTPVATVYLPIVIAPPKPPSPVQVTLREQMSNGTLYVMGQVKNNTNKTAYWQRPIVFYDGQGLIVGTGIIRPESYSLHPGQTSCFVESFSGYGQDWQQYLFEPEEINLYNTDYTPEIVSLININFIDGNPVRIYGQARNDGSTTIDSVHIIGALYDAAGQVIGCVGGFTLANNLAPGQASAFEISFYDWEKYPGAVSTYDLRVDD